MRFGNLNIRFESRMKNMIKNNAIW